MTAQTPILDKVKLEKVRAPVVDDATPSGYREISGSQQQDSEQDTQLWWFGIRCLTGKEELADGDLRALGLQTWAPTFRSLTKPRKRKKPVEVLRALIPGYVFAQVPPNMWPRVRAARNIIGWVAGENGPLPIRREVQLQKLRQRIEAGEFDHQGLGPNIRPGSMLEVLFGPMMGWRITFIGMVGKKIEGEIDLMGAPRRVLVNAQHVHLKG